MMEGSIDQVLNLSLRNPIGKNKQLSRNVIFAFYQIYYEDGFGKGATTREKVGGGAKSNKFAL